MEDVPGVDKQIRCARLFTPARAPLTGSLCSRTGDLVHVNVVGQPILVVGSAKVAYDLFERKSSIYSGRANSTMIIDLYGVSCFHAIFSY